MNIIQMRYFYEVCRLQNITKAAEYLHVSQPTISVAMQSLEAETGLNLFQRNGKRLSISKDGNILLSRVRSILEKIDDLNHEINDMAHKRNYIRVAVPPQVGMWIIPLLLGKFKDQYPQIVIEIIETGTENSFQLLKEDKLDIVVMNYTDDYREGFYYKKLGQSECCFCTYTENHLAAKAVVTIADIGNEPLVLLDASFNITHMIQIQFLDKGIRPNVIHYSPYLNTVRNLVGQKIASTFLMKYAVIEGEGIIRIPIKNPIYLNTGVVMKKGKQIYKDEQILIKFLKQHFVTNK